MKNIKGKEYDYNNTKLNLIKEHYLNKYKYNKLDFEI